MLYIIIVKILLIKITILLLVSLLKNIDNIFAIANNKKTKRKNKNLPSISDICKKEDSYFYRKSILSMSIIQAIATDFSPK